MTSLPVLSLPLNTNYFHRLSLEHTPSYDVTSGALLVLNTNYFRRWIDGVILLIIIIGLLRVCLMHGIVSTLY
jgi:hypothetical protein